jgi:hypothetical protein
MLSLKEGEDWRISRIVRSGGCGKSLRDVGRYVGRALERNVVKFIPVLPENIIWSPTILGFTLAHMTFPLPGWARLGSAQLGLSPAWQFFDLAQSQWIRTSQKTTALRARPMLI